jgi:hypothetical protein
MLWLTGCADQLVALRYTPDPEIQKIAGTQAMTVFRFVDARGDEGDHGDPTRVGGTYGGYGNRLSKVRASTPWAEALMQGLTVGLARRGVQAVTVDRVYAAGSQPVSTPLILAGEIRNFSTEQRWTLQSHISGIIRLYDSQGTLLLEKPISARTRIIDTDSRASDSSAPLEVLLNETLQKFVRAVVTDPELTQRLCFAAGWDKTTYTVAQPGSLLTPPGPAPKTVDLSRFLGPDWVYTTLSVAQSGLPLTRPTSALAGVESRDSIGRAAAAGQLR